jgi:hypothetical protein
MYIRPLTDAELTASRNAKETANIEIKKQRQALTKEIKRLEKGLKTAKAREALYWKREALKDIKGYPVMASLDGEAILLNYELLRKLDRSLEKRGWPRTVTIRQSALVIEYPAGEIGINQLPDYQAKLLKDLPVIRLDGPSLEELRQIEEMLS